MNTRPAAIGLWATLALAAAPAMAQDAAHAHGAAAGTGQLPAICPADAADAAPAMDMAMNPAMDAPHIALMEGMDAMSTQMMTAMTATDIDIAFVCSMIPHHQGAITMAKAELAHGDDPWAKAMAQKVIDAQQREIAEMLAWLGEQSAATP